MQLALQDGVLKIKTPCKINPYLDVLRKRDDGFHDLDTVMIALDLYDELTFEPSAETSFELSVEPNSAWIADQIGYNGNRLGRIQDNLVWQAIDLVSKALGVRKGIRAKLFKSIPIQAGLGGGSSDAAAALVAAQLLWTGRYNKALTCQLAARLGSDVNFFVEGHCKNAWTARCLGRGEIVSPFVMGTHCSWILVFPTNIQCSTARVFQNLNSREFLSTESGDITARFQEMNIETKTCLDELLFNRLYHAAEGIYPELADFHAKLSAIEPSVKFVMSGSGSSFVAPCRTEFAAQLSQTVSSAMECHSYVGECWKTQSIEAQINDLNIS
jgi:4-diphosphocytidyl-2-C-methyl-D-erythritol kinase